MFGPTSGLDKHELRGEKIALHAALPARGFRARMILTVHDELLFEAPAEEADGAAATVREQMEGVASLKVPLTVDVGVAENWRDAKP